MFIIGSIISLVAISASTASIAGSSVIAGASIAYGVKKYKENENAEYRASMKKREVSERRSQENAAKKEINSAKKMANAEYANDLNKKAIEALNAAVYCGKITREEADRKLKVYLGGNE